MISKDLHTYLEKRFREDNLKKYLVHFDVWVSNLTENQIDYFTKDMIKTK